ncbi:unnamed protein product [Ectocarpus fasciculatus]
MTFSVGNKVAGMFKRAKVLLPASRRAARAAKDLAEREEIEIELEAAFRSKMVVWGVLFTGLVLVMVLGMALLARRWSKRQAHRESALNHALEESRAETAAATDKTTMAEAKKETARSACCGYHRAFVERREEDSKARAAKARVDHDLQQTNKMVARGEAQKELQRFKILSLNETLVEQHEKTKGAERDLATCRAQRELATSSLESARASLRSATASLKAEAEAVCKAKKALSEADKEIRNLRGVVVDKADEVSALKGRLVEEQAQGRALWAQLEGTILQRDQARAASRPACACRQQQQVGEGSETPATDDLELDDEGFGVKQVKEVMLLSMEGLKPERERHLQRGRASSPPRAKKKAAAPGARRKGKKNKPPPAIASSNRWAVFAEEDDENDHEDEHEDEGEGKGPKGATPAAGTPVTSPPGRVRTRGKSPSPSRRRANNGREES